MSIHKKLASRLHKYAQMRWFYDVEDGDDAHDDMCIEDVLNTIADEIMRGDLDDVLGVREPTIEDVQREAARVFGNAHCLAGWHAGLFGVHSHRGHEVIAPTIAAAYAALRTMPDYEGEK